MLAVFGKGLPASLRIFLLALAILDDIVGIVFIAVLFTTDVNFGLLAAAVVAVVAVRRPQPAARHAARACRSPIALVVLAIATWVLVSQSGVHATIAGVALGLAMAQQPALRTRHALEPWVNGIVLPLFAFSAALVAIPAVSLGELSPAFWGVLVALPVGKIVGISALRLDRAAHRQAATAPAPRLRRPARRRRARRHRVHGLAAAVGARLRRRSPRSATRRCSACSPAR